MESSYETERIATFMDLMNQMYPQLEEKHPILSIRPTCAYLILRGDKRVENRKWKPLVNGHPYRGKLYIHVSKTFENKEEKRQFYAQFPGAKDGGVAGIVDLVDCVRNHPSRWAMPDCWHWVLENPREIKFVPMKGKLGLFFPT